VCVCVCASHGLRVNFAAGKSEALARTAGVRVLQAEFHLQNHPTEALVDTKRPVPLLELSDGRMLRSMAACRHLGGMVSASGSMGEEVAGRCTAARVATAALRRLGLAQRSIEQFAKTTAAQEFRPTPYLNPVPNPIS
jgi:hypothetical protein